ncbi:hypothetical protein [Streptomyces sp. DH37]|uniref:hypothetical protein n=1 Tax=Streptomyces sp. DH37 TaxID=3040122 RepID=UPI002441CB4F|nr:hypothetical protein [Streptomyces sp. DH37]MDG9703832.1 hypothetical protein [Streptomyces sp. DH37]
MRTTATTIAALAAVCALTLTACGSDSSDGAKAPAAKSQKQQDGQEEAVDCADTNLSQDDWTKHCADDAGSEEAPATELTFGQTFTYDDGLKVTVDSAKTVTDFDEYDDRPDADERLFRVNVTVDNDSKKPVDLDTIGVLVTGATNGGDAEIAYVSKGSKEMTGRLAPGVKDTKNSDWALAKEYGSQVLVTVTRMSEDVDLFAQDPEWTGPIR